MTRARSTPASPTKRNLVRIYALEAKTEFLKLWRLPAYSVATLVFPLMFYVIFGVTFGGSAGPVSVATYLLATYGAFGIIGAALFGFGVGVAVERGQGWMRLKRASPMPPTAYFVAKIAMALFFSLLIVMLAFRPRRASGRRAAAPYELARAPRRAARGRVSVLRDGSRVRLPLRPQQRAGSRSTSSTCRWPLRPACGFLSEVCRAPSRQSRPSCRPTTTRSSRSGRSMRARAARLGSTWPRCWASPRFFSSSRCGRTGATRAKRTANKKEPKEAKRRQR